MTFPVRWATEATTLLGLRAALGDDAAADLLFRQNYDAGFVSRHSNQLAGLFMAYAEGDES